MGDGSRVMPRLDTARMMTSGENAGVGRPNESGYVLGNVRIASLMKLGYGYIATRVFLRVVIFQSELGNRNVDSFIDESLIVFVTTRRGPRRNMFGENKVL